MSASAVSRPIRSVPVLAPRKHTYFDTLRLKPSGDHKETLFYDPMKFPSGDYKRRDIDCNMSCSGMIGTPLIFDLVAWSVVFEEFGNGDDIRTVLANTKFGLVRGYNRIDHSSVGSMFQPGIRITDGLASDWITPKNEPLRRTISSYKKATKQIRGALGAMARKSIWTHWYQMLDVDGKARRIESTDMIGVEVSADLMSLSQSIQLKVGLSGVLYTFP